MASQADTLYRGCSAGFFASWLVSARMASNTVVGMIGSRLTSAATRLSESIVSLRVSLNTTHILSAATLEKR